MISVNIIAGSGMNKDPRTRGIFSDMIEHVQRLIDRDAFELVVTETLDESRQYDVYHYWHSTLAVMNPKKLNRSLVTIHALDNLAPNRSFESKEAVLRKARAVSVMSEDMVDVLVSRGIPQNKIYWTPAGINVSDFLTPEDATLREGPVRLGVVSRRYDDGRKGEAFLIDILQELAFRLEWNPSGPAVVIVFIGSGWRELGLEEMFKGGNHLSFEYHVRGEDCDYSDYPAFYRDLDGLLVTSKVDAGPVCILEGVAAGIPVISTPTGLAHSVLTHRLQAGGKIGEIVPYGDAASFVDAINNMVFGPTSRTVPLTAPRNPDMRRMNALDVFDHDDTYSLEMFVARFAAIYAEIAAEVEGKVFASDYVNEDVYRAVNEDYGNDARMSLSNVYLDNFTKLRHYVQDGVGLINFDGAFEKKPAVIVGAGPSLTDETMRLLKENKDRILIVACDAVLQKFKKFGFYPDIVTVVDPSDRQIENFKDVDGRQFIPMMASVIHPMTFNESRKSDCTAVWYHVADGGIPFCKYIPIIAGPKGAISPAVLTPGMAYQIAVFLGCWPITFVGMDLCYYDLNNGYTEGLSQAKQNFQKMSKIFGGPLFAFPDIAGKIVLSENSFIAFHGWINDYLENQNLAVYNSSGQGILHGERIVQMPFDQWCGKFASQQPLDALLTMRRIIGEKRLFVDDVFVAGYDEETLEDMRDVIAGR